jgi:hypothetical protein
MTVHDAKTKNRISLLKRLMMIAHSTWILLSIMPIQQEYGMVPDVSGVNSMMLSPT